MREIIHGMKLDRYKMHNVEVVIDKLIVSDSDERRLKESLQVAMKQATDLSSSWMPTRAKRVITVSD